MTTAAAVSALIVEDTAIFRQLFKELLLDRYPFMCVAEARNAEEALGRIATSDFDLIFMDIALPGMNGIQLTKRIKAHHPEMKIVIVTSFGDPDCHAAALAGGADAFFSKNSVDGEAFAGMIDSFSLELGITEFRSHSAPDHRPDIPKCWSRARG